MPLVTGKVTVEIEGKVDDLLKDLKQIDKGLDNLSKKAKANRDAFNKSFQSSGLSIKSATSSWTEFRSAYSSVMDVVRVGQQIWGATAAKTIEFADAVNSLSQVTGAGAEETSRLLNVLDDYGISATQAMAATKTLNKNGLMLTTETLAKLSDQYRKLGTQQEKNAFALKNLGKNYTSYLDVLEKGGDAIRDQSDAVNENLILNQKQIDAAKRYQIAQDQMNDSALGWGNIVGNILIPAGQTLLSSWAAFGNALDIMKEKHVNFFTAFKEASIAVKAEQDALLLVTDAAGDAEGATEDLASAEDILKTATQRLTSEFTGLLGNMFTIQKENDKLTEDMDKLAKKEQELLDKRGNIAYQLASLTNKEKAAGEGYTESKEKLEDYIARIDELTRARMQAQAEADNLAGQDQKGSERYQQLILDIKGYDKELKTLDASKTKLATTQKGMNQDYEKWLDLTKESLDITNELSEIEAEKAKNTELLVEAGKKRIFDLTQQRLAADGVVDSGEFEYLQNLAVQTGLLSRAAADQAIIESKKADQYVQNYQRVHPLMANDLSVMQQMMALSGNVVQFGVNYTSNMPGSVPRPPLVNRPSTNQSDPSTRDSGGSGIAGTPYLIGTGAQPEMFIPNTNGTFIPNASKLGSVYNIVINNPKKEAAENSIRTALKKLSFVGVAA